MSHSGTFARSVDKKSVVEKCPWNMLDGEHWSDLLQIQPQFADKCPWEKLENEDCNNLLEKQPQFADRRP